MTRMPPPPLRRSSEAELDALERICDRLAGFDDSVSLERFDGWLCALATAPVLLRFDDAAEGLLGDAFERSFADPPDRAQALAAIEARLAVLRDQLDAEVLIDHPDELRVEPMMLEWSDDDRREAIAEHELTEEEAADLQTGALWAEGVLEGLDALPALGARAEPSDADDDAAAQREELMAQIEALLLRPGSDEWRGFVERYHAEREPTRDELIAEACFALQDLRVWALDHAPRPAPRRAEATPGRNDPCPCGSGKKYKKCHGAAGAGS